MRTCAANTRCGGWNYLVPRRAVSLIQIPATWIFFVEFIDYSSPSIADQWFGLQEDLEALFGVRVELVSARTAVNPYFLETVNRDKVTLFAA